MKVITMAPFFILLWVGTSACKFLSMEALEVTTHKPDTHVVSISELDAVTISFSAEVSRTSVETAFSLEEDGIEVPGKFEWTGPKKFIYRPFKSFNGTSRYLITITTAAEDTDGNSLDKEFLWEFRGTPDTTRPTVIRATPAENSRINTLRPEIVLEFSEAMNCSSVLDGISFQPSTTGYFIESNDNTTFIYKVTDDLSWQNWYTVTVNDSVRDSAGNTLGSDWSYSFFTGLETSELTISTATASGLNLIPENTETPTEEITEGIEKDATIVVLFSKPVDKETASGNINISPSLASDFTWNEAGDELTISYKKPFSYETTYTLSFSSGIADTQGNTLIRGAIYKFLANGPASRPPEVSAIYLTNSYSSETAVQPLLSLRPLDLITFPDEIPANRWNGFIDIYITVADGASICPFKFMEAFSISAEKASITPIACQTGAAITYMTATFPPAPPEGTEQVRVIVQIDNSDSAPGKINISLDSSFCDSLENYISSTWILDVYTTN